MTPAERDRAATRAFGYGAWVFVSVVMPARLIMNSASWWAWGVAGVLIVGHLAFLPAWQRSTRRFLLSTEWAKSRDFPTEIRLYQFRRTV